MSNIPITYIEFASCDTPSIRLLYSDIDISWKQALLVYRMEEEAEKEELFNMKLQARVRRLLMKRQSQKTGDSDMASSSYYCQETTAIATATNESTIPRQRTRARQHRASLCFAITDQRREQVVRPMKMKVEEEDCQSTLFDSSDFDTPSGYRVSTPTHWPTLDEAAVVDDVLPAPPATPISHKLSLHKEESSIYMNEDSMILFSN